MQDNPSILVENGGSMIYEFLDVSVSDGQLLDINNFIEYVILSIITMLFKLNIQFFYLL